ncbi:MAG: hypothetical protein OJF60_003516 [Burkholderiaceae bacterium]|jgi:hypothetical protein|nr:MAG: hypothetical protein OJF60_003516 [Burkholderiaceae bacterium]
MLTTELHTHTIPNVFSRFAQLVGETHWLKRVRLCEEAIRGNRFLDEYLKAENDIAFQLAHLSQLSKKHRGKVPPIACDDRGIYPAASFAAQVLSFADALSNVERDRFRGRVQGAFRNPNDMTGLRLELTIATHFIRRGKSVRWPEITGGGTFDLLVEDTGPYGLEIECKSVSNDKGRKIHQREILEFVRLLNPNLKPTIAGLRSGLYAVLTLPERLPTHHKDRLTLAKELGRAIFSNQSRPLADGSTVRIGEFDASGIDPHKFADHQGFHTLVDSITGTSNQHAVVMGNPAGGALAVAVQSAQDDELLKATFDTLANAARNQLSRRRAGMVIAGFSGLNRQELLSLARQDQDPTETPTALRVHASRFLSSGDRDHVVGAGFLSSGALRPLASGSVESGGTAYYFPNEQSKHWSTDFRGLFPSAENQ